MMFVVMVTNNDGGSPATLHEALDHAKNAVRAYLTDPDNQPPMTDNERVEMERDLAGVTGEYVQGVRGSDAWKEWVYVAPIAAPAPPAGLQEGRG